MKHEGVLFKGRYNSHPTIYTRTAYRRLAGWRRTSGLMLQPTRCRRQAMLDEWFLDPLICLTDVEDFESLPSYSLLDVKVRLR